MADIEQNYPKMHQICRLCLKEFGVDSVDIFQGEISLVMRIMAVSALEVQPNDGLPKAICLECRYQLEKSYNFRKRSQFADIKLRKHMRLLNLGKKSRVFAQTDEEKVEDELEFEDSVRILKQEDERREKELQRREQILKRKVMIKMQTKFEECKKVLKDLYREELKVECEQTVRKALREEVKEECRQIELGSLLCELETFLKSKRVGHNNKNKSGGDQDANMKNEVKSTTKQKKTIDEQPSCSTRLAPISDDNDESNGFDHQSLPFEVLTDEASIADEDYDASSNYYIVTNDCNEQESMEATVEDDVGSAFGSEEESDNFEMESTDRTISYQIEDNGEIQFSKNKIDLKNSTVKPIDDGNIKLEASNDNNAMIFIDRQAQRVDILEFAEPSEKPVVSIRTTNESSEVANKILPADTNVEKESIGTFAVITTSNQEPLVQHATDTPKTFKCNQCPWVFSTDLQRQRHMRAHAITEKKGVAYQCPECLIFVSCQSALTRHMVIHSGQRPYQCDECGKSFVQREILKRHMHIHTGNRPHKCHHCARSFTQKVNLTQHINKHHLEVPIVQLHQCHLCEKRFNHASGLSRHLATHSGVAFQCTECERMFQDRSSVKRHITAIHSGKSKNQRSSAEL